MPASSPISGPAGRETLLTSDLRPPGLTYKRFRDIRKATASILNSANSTAASRSQRAKRKLYMMSTCILAPYAAVQMAFLVFNLMLGWPWQTPLTLYSAQNDPRWSIIVPLLYDDVTFVEMNMSWIHVLIAAVIFLWYGTGDEAMSSYRGYLRALGLGRLSPRLGRDHDPSESSAASLWAAASGPSHPGRTHRFVPIPFPDR